MNTDAFQKFDYGSASENMAHYGQVSALQDISSSYIFFLNHFSFICLFLRIVGKKAEHPTQTVKHKYYNN